MNNANKQIADLIALIESKPDLQCPFEADDDNEVKRLFETWGFPTLWPIFQGSILY
jgi:hypothetical protein